MYKILSNNGDTAHDIKEYACDTIDDLQLLPKHVWGSTAFVISTSEVYMQNSQGEWVKI